jgi:hypothetical protein
VSKVSFLNLHKEEGYRLSLIDMLTTGIGDEWIEYFEMTLNYVINEKWELFDIEELHGQIYHDEDEILDLILPAVRRVFAKVFIDPPKVFVPDSVVRETTGWKDDGRLELFRLHYNIDDFLIYLKDMILNNSKCLGGFVNIDRSVTLLEIIVDNYIAGLIKLVTESEDIKSDIRDLKIKNLIE